MGIQNLREVQARNRSEADVRALRPSWKPYQYVRDGRALGEIVFDSENEDGDMFDARFFSHGVTYGEQFTEFWRAKSWLEKQIKERGL